MTPFVTALDKVHEVKDFTCGKVVLDVWLQQTARQHQANSISQTFVLVAETAPTVILGFYALTLRGLTSNEDLPPEIAKRLPRKVPGITLARLAVMESEQGKNYGEELLVDAMLRARDAAKGVGGWGLFVDAKDEEAASFYQKYGFTPCPSNPLVLVMPFASMPP
jgi:GNAT superfamily N-acetyltransferase